ncbi:MAG: hypothetical protein ACPGXK_08615 [Phycisphaerae bacterium]
MNADNQVSGQDHGNSTNGETQQRVLPNERHASTGGHGVGVKQSQTIISWLGQAMLDHRGDAYPGKRDHSRYRDEFDLEATLEPDKNDRVPMRAIMHNICSTGIAFWVRTEIEPGTLIYLRNFKADTSDIWVETKATHCTRGIRGYLIGAEFSIPVSEADIPKPVVEEPAAPEDDEEPKKKPGMFGWLGLR